MSRIQPADPPTVDADPVRCFACGHAYWFLGHGPHPGVCPGCGARGVSPAGELRVVGTPVSFSTGTEDETFRIDAADDTDRAFHYWVTPVEDGRQARVVRIRVADTVVGPKTDAWPDDLAELVPTGLERAADRADLRLVAPDSIFE